MADKAQAPSEIRTLADGVHFLGMDGEYAILKVNVKRSLGPSKTGKSLMTANTRGNVKVPSSDASLSVKAFFPNPDKPKGSGDGE